jgi:pimeloyl-ACP methyl ester carboxylesterase
MRRDSFQLQTQRDLKTLLEAHRGAGNVYVYGVSYGTQLVLRMLQLGEVHLDGLVLDSLAWRPRTWETIAV